MRKEKFPPFISLVKVIFYMELQQIDMEYGLEIFARLLICTRHKICYVSEHACKMFFSSSKICAINPFRKEGTLFTPKHVSRANPHNGIGRNPSMVTPLLANQNLTPMLQQTGMGYEAEIFAKL